MKYNMYEDFKYKNVLNRTSSTELLAGPIKKTLRFTKKLGMRLQLTGREYPRL